MKFLSLFAGIGGFDLGFERSGMECVGQVEIDRDCRRVLEKHWPDVKRVDDVRKVKGTEFGKVDLICGGYPCQPFSQAGRKSGFKDERHLWPEMARIISVARPSWVVGENTIGHLRLGLDLVLSDLEKMGYTARAFDIPAFCVGAPHKRSRCWVIACLDNGSGGRHLAQEEEICPRWDSLIDSSRWKSKPPVCRVADGVSPRLDKIRIKMLGNAVVPQIVERIGRAIRNVQ